MHQINFHIRSVCVPFVLELYVRLVMMKFQDYDYCLSLTMHLTHQDMRNDLPATRKLASGGGKNHGFDGYVL